MATLSELRGLQDDDTPYRPVSLAELTGKAEKPGFVKSVVQSVASPFLRFGVTGANIIGGVKELVKGGDVESALKKEVDFGYLGKVKPIEGTKQAIGVGIEAGSNLPFGIGAARVGKATLGGLVKQGFKAGVKEGAIGGAMFGVGSALGENGGVGDALKRGTLGALIGSALGGTAGAAFPVAGAAVRRGAALAGVPTPGPNQLRIDSVLDDAINKGIKPSVTNTSTSRARDAYTKKARQAFQIIDAADTKFPDEAGNLISRNPQNRIELLDGIHQTKQAIYTAYHKLSEAAGDGGAKFNAGKPATMLYDITKDVGYSKKVRDYADEVINEILELEGKPPEVIERRIQEYNSSLVGYFAGRVDKAKARIDASIANLLRAELDDMVEQGTGKAGYQALRNQYGTLKTIEKDVARQVAIEARKGTKGLLDFTDIFTGADLLQGFLTTDPTALVRGASARGIKEFYKWLNDPNRFIKNAFDTLESLRVNKITPVNMKAGGIKNPFAKKAFTKLGDADNAVTNKTSSQLDPLLQEARKETITLYRAAPKFPSDKFEKGTYFADNAQSARYYSESHYKGDIGDIKVEQFTLPKDAVFKEPSTGNYILKGEAPVSKIDPLIAEARKYKSAEVTDYGMSHRPTEVGVRSFDLIEKVDGDQMIPKDMYTQWYGSRGTKADLESIAVLKKIKGKPEASVTVYRASPKESFNNGDWVTFSKTYAQEHATGNKTKVYSKVVKAKDIRWAMDDINEFGYYPSK